MRLVHTDLGRCAATAEAPASDIAGQLAVGLAMLAKFFRDSSFTGEADKALVPLLTQRAKQAYAYARAMLEQHGEDSTCSKSPANKNCVGETCDPGYFSVRPPSVAATALTGAHNVSDLVEL